MPLGRVGRLLFPLLLPLPPLLTLAPVLLLALALLGLVPDAVRPFAAAACVGQLLFWAAVYLRAGHSPLNALGDPLGAAVFLYIVATATARGRRVAWKGREYRHE